MFDISKFNFFSWHALMKTARNQHGVLFRDSTYLIDCYTSLQRWHISERQNCWWRMNVSSLFFGLFFIIIFIWINFVCWFFFFFFRSYQFKWWMFLLLGNPNVWFRQIHPFWSILVIFKRFKFATRNVRKDTPLR